MDDEYTSAYASAHKQHTFPERDFFLFSSSWSLLGVATPSRQHTHRAPHYGYHAIVNLWKSYHPRMSVMYRTQVQGLRAVGLRAMGLRTIRLRTLTSAGMSLGCFK